MKKRCLALLLCLLLCLGMFPGFAQATSEEPATPAEESAPYVPEEPVAEIAAEPVEEAADEPVLDGEGPQPSQSDFTVTFEISGLPSELISSDLIVRMDRDQSDNFIAYTGTNTVSNFSAAVTSGEWAIFGYKNMDGYTASWDWSPTMAEGLYAHFETDPGKTVILNYTEGSSTDPNNPSGGSSGTGQGPTVADYDFDLSVSVSYPAEYTGEKNGGLQRVNENYEPISGEVYQDGDTVSIQQGELALFTYVKLDDFQQTSLNFTGSGGSEDHNGTQYIRLVGTGQDGKASATVAYGGNTGSSGEPGGNNNDPSGEITGANYYDVRLDGHSDVGMYSANIHMTWWAPVSNVQNDYRLYLTYGTTPDLLYTDGGIDLGVGGADAKIRSFGLGDLKPNTTYYYQVYMLVGDAGEYEIKNGRPYSDGSATIIYGTADDKPATFTTADGAPPPCYEVIVPAGSADFGNTEVLCQAKDPSGTDAAIPLSFHQPNPNDVLNHDGELRFTVSEDGLYCLRPVHTPDGAGTSSTGPYDIAEAVYLTISGVNEKGELVYANQLTNFFCKYNGYLAGTAVNLKAGITYTVKLNSGGGSTKLSVLRIYENNVNFTADLSVEQGTRDGRVWRTVAKIEYAADATFYHGLLFNVRYDTKEHYEQTGELRWSCMDAEIGTYQPGPAATSGYTYRTLGRVVPGVEYVCQVMIYKENTAVSSGEMGSSGEPAVALCSDLVYYTGANDYPLTLSMGENLNYENKPQVLAEMADYTYYFRTGEEGHYLFNLNKLGATLELYDKDGKLLSTGSNGSLGDRGWTSTTAHLEGEKTYYLYISGLNTTIPIVTINRIEGRAEPEDELIELPAGSEDTARDCLDRTINDLTKTGTGEDAPLPDYVDADTAGEEALRQAIEEGNSLTAEVEGQTLTEDEVAPEELDAMNELAEQELVDSESVLFVELSVDLTLDGERICQITELDEELEFIVDLTPEQKEQFRGKAVHVARCHGDGEPELIPGELIENGTRVRFRTGRFSTFGIYLAEPISETPADDGVVKTGDSQQPLLWAMVFVTLGAALTLTIGSKKRSRS